MASEKFTYITVKEYDLVYTKIIVLFLKLQNLNWLYKIKKRAVFFRRKKNGTIFNTDVGRCDWLYI